MTKLGHMWRNFLLSAPIVRITEITLRSQYVFNALTFNCSQFNYLKQKISESNFSEYKIFSIDRKLKGRPSFWFYFLCHSRSVQDLKCFMCERLDLENNKFSWMHSCSVSHIQIFLSNWFHHNEKDRFIHSCMRVSHINNVSNNNNERVVFCSIALLQQLRLKN